MQIMNLAKTHSRSPDRGSSGWITVLAWALVVAAASFIAYPALRPYSDERSAEGAAAMGSTAWVLAHTLAMVGFSALPLAALAAAAIGPAARSGRVAVAAAWCACVLLLPYDGGETFGLGALARAAQTRGDTGLLVVADDIRMSVAPAAFFALGSLALLIHALAMSACARRAGVAAAWTAPYVAGLSLFVPQFFLAPPLRVAHGVLLGGGCLLLAAGWSRLRRGT